MPKRSPGYFIGRKCFKCGRSDTRKNTFGSYLWYSHKDNHGNSTGNWICYYCERGIGRPKTPDYFEGRECCICGSKDTRQGFSGKPQWYRYKDKNGVWDRESYVCYHCWQKIHYEDKREDIRSESQWRMGELSRYVETGIGIIGQYVVAKTLGIDDLNILKDNFRQPVDLSEHSIYGTSDVKTATLTDYNRWIFGRVSNICDTVFYLGMDRYMPWRNVEMICAVPCDIVFNDSSISIYNDIPKGRKWDVLKEYKIDKKPFNDTYHNVNIPDLFSPIDLWEGKYDCNK